MYIVRELAYGLEFRYSYNRLLPHTRTKHKELLDSDRWLLRIRIQQDFTLQIGIMTVLDVVVYRYAGRELQRCCRVVGCIYRGYGMVIIRLRYGSLIVVLVPWI